MIWRRWRSLTDHTIGARMDEEQRVVQPGGERELVGFEHERRRPHDQRRQHGVRARRRPRPARRSRRRARSPSARHPRAGSARRRGARRRRRAACTNRSRNSRTCGLRHRRSLRPPGGSSLRSGASGKPHSANRPTASLTTCASARPRRRVVVDLGALDLELGERAPLERRERALADLERPAVGGEHRDDAGARDRARARAPPATRAARRPCRAARAGRASSSHSSWPSGITSRFSEPITRMPRSVTATRWPRSDTGGSANRIRLSREPCSSGISVATTRRGGPIAAASRSSTPIGSAAPPACARRIARPIELEIDAREIADVADSASGPGNTSTRSFGPEHVERLGREHRLSTTRDRSGARSRPRPRRSRRPGGTRRCRACRGTARGSARAGCARGSACSRDRARDRRTRSTSRGVNRPACASTRLRHR